MTSFVFYDFSFFDVCKFKLFMQTIKCWSGAGSGDQIYWFLIDVESRAQRTTFFFTFFVEKHHFLFLLKWKCTFLCFKFVYFLLLQNILADYKLRIVEMSNVMHKVLMALIGTQLFHFIENDLRKIKQCKSECIVRVISIFIGRKIIFMFSSMFRTFIMLK